MPQYGQIHLQSIPLTLSPIHITVSQYGFIHLQSIPPTLSPPHITVPQYGFINPQSIPPQWAPLNNCASVLVHPSPIHFPDPEPHSHNCASVWVHPSPIYSPHPEPHSLNCASVWVHPFPIHPPTLSPLQWLNHFPTLSPTYMTVPQYGFIHLIVAIYLHEPVIAAHYQVQDAVTSDVIIVQTQHTCRRTRESVNPLTHCGLVTSYGEIYGSTQLLVPPQSFSTETCSHDSSKDKNFSCDC